MPRIRTMGAGLGGSTANNVNVNANTGGGNKKQGLSTTTNKRVQFVSPAIKTRSYGENRNVVFCMNQLGGVGAVSGGNGSRMFGTTSDGVKDCITGPYGCEQVVREAYLEAYGREPDKSGLRTYCLAMTKRRWSKADVIADLEKNPDLLAPIYASLAGSYRILVYVPDYDGGLGGELADRTVNIDSLGNITGTDTLKIGKITVNTATEHSLTMDEYGVTNAEYIGKAKASVGSLEGGMPKIEACELFFYQDDSEGEKRREIYFLKDTDGDGFADFFDEFPLNPTETQDTDGDGVGDNADAFPNDPNETKDTDGDGVGDNADAFPNDPTETKDTDGDGVGDNADAFPNDPNETKDTDGDGVGDNSDAFPNDPNETVDTDGDGVGDNADAFPNDPNKNKVTEPPVITLNGPEEVTIEVLPPDPMVGMRSVYEDPGATATDEVGANLDIVVTGTDEVDLYQIGTYTITYTATDTYGLSSTATRTVNVVNSPSTFILRGGTSERQGDDLRVGDTVSVAYNIRETTRDPQNAGGGGVLGGSYLMIWCVLDSSVEAQQQYQVMTLPGRDLKYTIRPDDIGEKIRATIFYTDDTGYYHSATTNTIDIVNS